VEYAVLCVAFGIWTGLTARAKGGSFWIWLMVGSVLPVAGLIAAVLMRHEDEEPERTCPNCGTRQKLYVQVCTRCGRDLYFSDAEPPPT